LNVPCRRDGGLGGRDQVDPAIKVEIRGVDIARVGWHAVGRRGVDELAVPAVEKNTGTHGPGGSHAHFRENVRVTVAIDIDDPRADHPILVGGPREAGRGRCVGEGAVTAVKQKLQAGGGITHRDRSIRHLV